ncbi:alkaline phytoceramidase [Ophiostoma piceae UAMH 11346]|uniref:Alkaline phytoceramidase n=1 Tax=Ophiostoma piceae (strain UAMH 11346) TaxID=1262450 RepID=S3BPP1_OPHP1|nr:alkaline phytoceramidase [Ophiostoma piceae UAMH 11346]
MQPSTGLTAQDYNVTEYCAEFVNCLTNLMFLYLGFRGIRDCIRYQHPSVFIVAFIGYIVVGLGSIAFHMTLKYSMQLADELPMIYATCIIGHATFSYKTSRLVSALVGAGLTALAATITVVYYITKDPVFHQLSYGALTVGIVLQSMYTMEYQLRPVLKARVPDTANAIMDKIWRMCLSGIGLFLVGFVLWNIDNVYCGHLRSWRHAVLLPWSVVLEGHGWWHIFTGLGAYYFIVWRMWLQRCLDGTEEFRLKWDSAMTTIPRVVPVTQDRDIETLSKRRRD